MADRDELVRALERDLPSRERRRLDKAAATILPTLDPHEQILKTVAGTWYSGARCLVVATSRRIVASDGDRLDDMPYNRMLALDYKESWRKARIMVRAHGAGADIRDIQLDTARELKRLIETAKRSVSTPGTTVPPGV